MLKRTTVVAAVVAAALAATPAHAGPHDDAIKAVVDRAVEQWALFLTCSQLDPGIHADIYRAWSNQREDLDPLFARADLAPEMATAIAVALATAVQAPETLGDAATLIAYCSAGAGWYRTFAIGRDVIRPAREIEAILGP